MSSTNTDSNSSGDSQRGTEKCEEAKPGEYVYRMSNEEFLKKLKNPMTKEELLQKMTQLITEYEAVNYCVTGVILTFDPSDKGCTDLLEWDGEKFAERKAKLEFKDPTAS
jgi:hypothetical protein